MGDTLDIVCVAAFSSSLDGGLDGLVAFVGLPVDLVVGVAASTVLDEESGSAVVVAQSEGSIGVERFLDLFPEDALEDDVRVGFLADVVAVALEVRLCDYGLVWVEWDIRLVPVVEAAAEVLVLLEAFGEFFFRLGEGTSDGGAVGMADRSVELLLVPTDSFGEVDGLSLVAVVDKFPEVFAVANFWVHGRKAFDLVGDREEIFLGDRRYFDVGVFCLELTACLGMFL